VSGGKETQPTKFAPKVISRHGLKAEERESKLSVEKNCRDKSRRGSRERGSRQRREMKKTPESLGTHVNKG